MPLPRPTRRQLLVGGGVGAGLLVGFALWPRDERPGIVANQGETVFGGYLKIAESGQITVVVPQTETGQGVWTALPQILADELGADWRTIAVEPAPIAALYANRLFADEEGAGFARIAGAWTGRASLMLTGGSSSIRAFEQALRAAGATARVLLCKAAAARWDADWQACDTALGFVTRGEDRLRFGELAVEAAAYPAPDPAPLREGAANRLTGQPLPRLDTPAKLDGSARFAGDIRLPDMVFAAIRHGPLGHRGLIGYDRAAAEAAPGVIAVVDTPRWIAAVATNWWAANSALDRVRARFQTAVEPPSSDAIAEKLRTAIDDEGERVAKGGDLAAMFVGARLRTADYWTGFAPHAALETLTATARLSRGKLELWLPTTAPGLARAAAARALDLAESAVTIYPTFAGGGFGRLLENEAGAEAAILAARLNRPVQLVWSRAEDLQHDRFRPPAFARMSARLGPTGLIEGWLARIAAPDTPGEQARRMFASGPGARLIGRGSAVAGAMPPYAIPAFAIDHHPVEIGVPTGHWRGGGHVASCFFTESFVDELARASGLEPLSFRMQLLTANPRLARCLSSAAATGGWEGGASAQGLACHSMAGSHVALLAEATVGSDQRIRVSRVVAVADVGRVINPELVRQQIEGGILYGLAAATGAAVEFENGAAAIRNLAQLAHPRLTTSPEIVVELVRSSEAPGGASEIAVPPIGPAIANALAAGGAARPRSLPLRPGAA